MSSFTISNSDLEILNALTIVDSIRKDLVSNSCFESSCNASYGHGESKRTISSTCYTNDSAICSTNNSVTRSSNDSVTRSTNDSVTRSTNDSVTRPTNVETTHGPVISANAGATYSLNVDATCSINYSVFRSTNVDATYFDATCLTSDGATCSTNDSIQDIFRKANQIFSSFQLDSEFQAISQDIQTVYLMNDMFVERKKALEKIRAKEMSAYQEILSKSVLSKRLENINLVIKHMLTIASQVSKIKQALQDAPYKTTLKVDPSCQASVVKFFHIADAIIKKLQEDTSHIEFSNKNVSQVIPVNEMSLHSKLQSIITGLARRLDILTEFRNCLLMTEETELGVELEVSESKKLETFEQSSTTDSGINLLLNPLNYTKSFIK